MVFNATFNNISAKSWVAVSFIGGGNRSTPKVHKFKKIKDKSLSKNILLFSSMFNLTNLWAPKSHNILLL
jgi:hypothetical protein